MSSKSILSDRFNDACRGLKDCKSLKRLQQVLIYYKSIINDNNQQKCGSLLMEYLKTTNYKNMMNDYHHILLKHLNAENNSINAQNYDLINESTVQSIECPLADCKCYKIINDDNDSEQKENKDEDEKKAKQNMTACVYIELLNNIHLLIVHGYDIGFRVKYDDDNKINNDENKDVDNVYFDKEISMLSSCLKEKRQAFIKVRGEKRIQQNRFVTTPVQSVNEEKSDEEKKENNSIPCIDYGQRFYYWNWYKNNKDNDPDNRGYKYGDMYIEKKHNNLKEEIAEKLDINKFNYATTKATKFLKFALLFKKLKSRDTLTCGLHYDIAKRKPLTVNHLLSVILYTDYDTLSHLFRLTFIKNSMNENIDNIKKRNSGFWYLSKLLRETVEVFGDRLGDKPKICILYHVTSFIYVNAAITRIYSPVSMTRQLCVAVLMAPVENGIVLDVMNYGYDKPYYFNCGLLGFGGAEDERLMFGGKQLTQFPTIRMIEIAENYPLLMTILKVLNIIIRGESLSMQDKDEITKNMNEYCEIIQQLIDAKMFEKENKLNNYFNMAFKAFTNKQKMIKIDMKKLARDFGMLTKIFVFSDESDNEQKINNLLLFDFICKLFVNCNEIDCDMGSGGGSIDELYFGKLTEILNNICGDSKTQLKMIRIIKCKCSGLSSFQQNNTNWDVNKAGSTKLILTKKL